mmetsp:Transcript_34328/g.61848  ORF Transcript_34328/g.61848 Transcript_34328/m.61848 type:complete len:441 (-) Transcript_34328:150-1472(-)
MAMYIAADAAEAKVASAPAIEKPRRPAVQISLPEVSVPEEMECSKGQEEERGLETATTDIGSGSESDSFFSSTEASDSRCEQSGSLSTRGPLGLRRRTAPRLRGHFGGTHLETIPGTPVASDVCGQPFPVQSSEGEPTCHEVAAPFQPDTTDESETEMSGRLLQPMTSGGASDDVPALPRPRSPKRRPRPDALCITEPNEPTMKPAVNAVALGPFGTVPALPPPRSPKRRARAATAQTSREETMPSVTAVALGPFGTVPAPPAPRSPKRRARAAAASASQEDAMPAVTAVRCSSFGTVPATKRRQRPSTLAADGTSVTSVQFGLYGTTPKVVGMSAVPPSPKSPKKRAREMRDAVAAKAKREEVPLKVWLCDSVSTRITGLDPQVPAKKRPVFGETAGPGPAAALRRLEPGMPVKKRVSKFFLEEPLMMSRPPPGLEDII